jgi:hypothetical protein
MKRSKYTEEQIAFALKQAELGIPVGEVIRKMGITEQAYCRWKKKYGDLDTSELHRLRQMEEENRKLKQMVADLKSRQAYAPGGAVKKCLKPAREWELVRSLMDAFRITERRACNVMIISRSNHNYQSERDGQAL